MKAGFEQVKEGSDTPRGVCGVINVSVSRNVDTSYRFDVTICSKDYGWGSFADAFETLGPGDIVPGKRILAHLYETEQPFTCSLDTLAKPDGIETVPVCAHHNVYGFPGQTITVSLP